MELDLVKEKTLAIVHNPRYVVPNTLGHEVAAALYELVDVLPISPRLARSVGIV